MNKITSSTSAARDPPALDLSSCEREQIHIPGKIQPHGILLGFSRDTLRITAVSANATAFLGSEANDVLDAKLSRVLDDASFAAVSAGAALESGESSRVPRLRLSATTTNNSTWRATLHAHADDLLLEAEFAPPNGELTAIEELERFQTATHRLQMANDIESTCQRLVEEVRRVTGYDRVKLYRFAPDWNGEVIAEAASGEIPSFLGLHFPASDIPAQARALYARNAERQIPDVAYMPVPILQTRSEPLDLAQVGLRSVSPLHIAYLRNMGAGASMSISVMRRGALWGLIACHHRTPYNVPLESRQSSVLLTKLAEARLSLLEETLVARRGVVVKALETKLLHEAADGSDYRQALKVNGGSLLDLLDASGMALVTGGKVTTLGKTPAGAALDALLAWLTARTPNILVTDHLAGHYPAAADLPEAAGILAVPLGGVPTDLLVWFRPEMARTVTWAGDPIKPVERADGVETLTPRVSFDAWVQRVRGRSRLWSAPEIAAANSLRDTIVDIIVRRALDMERMNAQLKRSNDELEAFAYVASHDLKEPLRQIETFGTLLERAFARKTDPAEKVARWFSGIHTSSRRLRRLINDLAEFSRLGGEAKPFAPVDLGELVGEVIKDLETRVDELGAVIAVGPLPTVMCDATQMRQVFQNLIANALKYRHPDRPPVIRISPEPHPDESRPNPLGIPLLEFSVADNGIGFEARHRELIFEPFERLHSTDEYEGSGLGLAICRKVVNRHGGTITASAVAGEGAVFVFSLPLRALPAEKALLP